MSFFGKVIRNTAYLVASEVVTRIFFLGLAILIARKLGPAGLGQYGFVMAFVMVLVPISELGLTNLAIQKIAQGRQNAANLVANIITLRLFAATAVAGICAICIFLFVQSKETALLLFVGLLISFCYSLNMIAASIFRAYEKMEYQALTELVGSAVVVGLAVMWLFLGRGVVWVLISQALGSIVAIAIAVRIVQKKFLAIKFQVDLPAWKKLAAEGLYFWLAFIMALLLYNIDMLMLFGFRGSTETGIYKAAYSVVRNIEIIPPLFTVALYPALVKLIKKSKADFVKTYKRSLGLMTLAGLALTAVVIAAAGPLIRIVYGPEFTQSVPVLQALSATIFFFLIGSLNTHYLYAAGRQKQSVAFQTIGIALTIVLGLLFIPKFGIGGAVFACVTGLGISYILKQTYITRMNKSLIIQHE